MAGAIARGSCFSGLDDWVATGFGGDVASVFQMDPGKILPRIRRARLDSDGARALQHKQAPPRKECANPNGSGFLDTATEEI